MSPLKLVIDIFGIKNPFRSQFVQTDQVCTVHNLWRCSSEDVAGSGSVDG
jgi:hypothetical protein